MKFRKLKANEIEARVATVSAKGCSLLLYKDARVDQNVLDETVGAENWKRSHQLIGENLYCTVDIWDSEKQQWVSKQDVGTESYTEKEKGQASDSFKRACFNWGIGRELYTAPFIWINAVDANINGDNGRFTTKERFDVAGIGYDDDGNINYLKIVNEKTRKMVYLFGKEETDEVISDKEKQTIEEMLKKRGYTVKEIFPKGLNLTPDQYVKAIANINAMPPKDIKK